MALDADRAHVLATSSVGEVAGSRSRHTASSTVTR